VLGPQNNFYFFTDPSGMAVVNASGLGYISAILLADEGDGNLDQNLRVSLCASVVNQWRQAPHPR
jgi:hypothetical protein